MCHQSKIGTNRLTPFQVGRLDSEKPLAIRLSGENISEEHCYFDNNDGKVTLYALPNAVTVSSVFT